MQGYRLYYQGKTFCHTQSPYRLAHGQTPIHAFFQFLLLEEDPLEIL